MMNDAHDTIRSAIDGSAVTIMIGAFFGWLPHIAALLTVAWMAVRFYNEIQVARDRKRARDKEET